MGADVAAAEATAKATFEAADAALGSALSTICFEGPDETLALTENTQPAILTVSVALWRALAERGVTAEATAGHSLGEYSAHVAAGTLKFEDAVRAVRSRGQFMQQAVPVGAGAMAAIIGLDGEQIDAICAAAAQGEVVSAANLNAPGQVVIAGSAAAVDRAIEGCKEAGAKRALPLNVSAPFHCALMQPAADQLADVLTADQFSDPSMPVYTNVDAAPVNDAAAARDALLRQVASPVRWTELIEKMLDDGFDTFIEIGPGNVLSGLMRRIRKGTRCHSVSSMETLTKTVDALKEEA